jgi:hypothetical protein
MFLVKGVGKVVPVLCQTLSIPPSLPPSPPLTTCCSHLEHRASVKLFVSLQFLNLTQTVGLLGRGISPSQGSYLHTNRINTNIHTLSGIRTHDLSVRSGEDISCLRPRDHRDRRQTYQFLFSAFCVCVPVYTFVYS